ncbi:hypothetical protein Mapa_009506 [Marchantia paleacea]|nr:hypothetical protein Mapa_009506 [Marchantia paleacea]
MAGAAQYLQELPSRGFFSSSQQPASQGGLRVYICDHETAPPEEQLIKTDSTNILIRYLTLKKTKVEQNGKDNKRKSPSEDGKGKRHAERSCDDKIMIKRVNVSGGSGGSRRGWDKPIFGQGASKFHRSEDQGFTQRERTTTEGQQGRADCSPQADLVT